MKNFTLLPAALLFLSATVSAQVGVNTTTPSTTVDVRAKRDSGGNITDNTQLIGLQAPRLTRAELTANTATYGINQQGAQIYITDVTGGTATGQRVNIDAIGYYYFDGTVWQKIGAAATSGDATNDEWVNSTGSVILGKKADGTTARDAGTDFVVLDNGNTAIGTATPNTYALLDVSATNKGILAPRVNLTSSTFDLNADGDSNVANQPAGLLVYNVGGGATSLGKGYYYWDGTMWKLFDSKTSVAPQANINCTNPILDPNQVIQGGVPLAAGTVMKVPYSAGNGGHYTGVVLQSVGNTNVTATLADGNLEAGSGFLNFYLSGTPTAAQQSPTGIQFDLTPFYTANPSFSAGCTTVKIGVEVKADLQTVAVQDNFKLTNDNGVVGYSVNITTPDGKWSVRAFIAQNDGTFGTDARTGMNLQIRNNTSADIIIAGQYNWFWGGAGGNGSNLMGYQPGVWSGDMEYNAGNTTVVWAGFLNSSSGTVNCAAPSASKTNSCNRSTYWGNAGVYAGGSPERRTYSWTENSATSKTSYILTFSSYSSQPGVQANSANCPGGVCSQSGAYMIIQQITAP